MNREALPLIIALLIPITVVSLIILYFSGYDVTLSLRNFLKELPVIYYLVLVPIFLSFLVAILKWKESR